MKAILIKYENLLTGEKRYFTNCHEAITEVKRYLELLMDLEDHLRGNIAELALEEYKDYVCLQHYNSEEELREMLANKEFGGFGCDIITLTKVRCTQNAAKVYKALQDCPCGASILALTAMTGIESRSSVFGSLVGLERHNLVERVKTKNGTKKNLFWKLKED